MDLLQLIAIRTMNGKPITRLLLPLLMLVIALAMSLEGANAVLQVRRSSMAYVEDWSTGAPIAGASVYLDDTLVGTTDSSGGRDIRTVSAGSHQLRVSKDGYTEYETVVNVSDNGAFTARIRISSKITGNWVTFVYNSAKDMDVTATVNQLKAAHVNLYFYFPYDDSTGKNHWNQLPSFLTAAQSAGINVIVIAQGLPSTTYSPYGSDYVAWITYLATLSRTYPNLKGAVIDDWIYQINPADNTGGNNTGLFTVGYMEQIYAAKNSVNPSFKFLVDGYDSSDRAGSVRSYVINTYSPYIDGLQVDHEDNVTTSDAYCPGGMAYRIQQIRAMLGSNKLLYVGVYVGNPAWHGGVKMTLPNAQDAMQIAYANSDGPVAYCLALSYDLWDSDHTDEFYYTMYPLVQNLFGNWTANSGIIVTA